MLSITRTAALALVASLAVAGCTKVVEAGNDVPGGELIIDVTVPATDATDSTDPTDSAGATASPDETLPTDAVTDTTVGGDEGTGAGGGDEAVTGTTVPGDAASFRTGDCLTWDQDASSALFTVVACEQQHFVEVAGSLDLGERYGSDATFPPAAEVSVLAEIGCGPVVQAYLGKALPDGVQAGLVLPTRSAWSTGARDGWCTVGLARVDGKRPAYTGRVADRA